jgi:flagellar motor switch protein FliN
MADQPTQEQIDELMRQLSGSMAQAPAPASAAAPIPAAPPRPAAPRTGAAPARIELEPLAAPATPPRSESGLDFLGDVDVELRVELGTTRLNVQEILRLGSGSVVALESLVGDPVSLYVNDRLVGRGEVLVVNDNFAVRITEVLPVAKPEPPPASK